MKIIRMLISLRTAANVTMQQSWRRDNLVGADLVVSDTNVSFFVPFKILNVV